MLAENFAYLAVDEGVIRRQTRLARQYGVVDKMIPCRPMNVPFSVRHQAFTDPTQFLSIAEPIAKEAASAGANALILSDNILNMVMRHHGLTEIGGVPVLEASSVLLKSAEMLVDLAALGVKRSHLAHPRATSEDLAWLEKASKNSEW